MSSMSTLPSLPAGILLALAALVMALGPFLPRRVVDSLAVSGAAATSLICIFLLKFSFDQRITYWFGGWQPQNGICIGISFMVDPFSAGAAALVCLLGSAAFLFAWHYFDSVGTLFHTLMLVFLAGMVGFCLSADLFTLFVFFELMGVTAYGLTGYKIEESSLAGSMNFAVTNSIAAFMILFGIGLLYGRTGALNMAQISRSLQAGPVDGLVITALVLVIAGLLVKGSVVPFHFWLADAHAVAPTPVCILFSGIMVGLGIYGAARVYWSVFAAALGPDQSELRIFFLWAGIVTSVIGGLMCFLQRHLKRLLAFSSISHMGVLLTGVSLFDPLATAGTSIYLLFHGFIKGALFINAGTLLHVFSGVDEFELRGRGKKTPMTGVLFGIGGLLLAGIPPFGLGLGKSFIELAAERLGYSWLSIFLFFPSALSGGAVLRATGRIFLGLGNIEGEEKTGATESEKQETTGKHGHALWFMVAPAVALTVMAIVGGFYPALEQSAGRGADLFQDWAGYQKAVLHSRSDFPSLQENITIEKGPFQWKRIIPPLGAVGLAFFSLFAGSMPKRVFKRILRVTDLTCKKLQQLHSGHVGDYVAWLAVGVSIFGIFLFLNFLRR